jgi:putative transposase
MPRRDPDPHIRRGRSAVYTVHPHPLFVTKYCRPVFVTKYCRPVFTDTMLTHCEQLMRTVCCGAGAELREFNAQTDHVHLLVYYPPSVALLVLVNQLKGVSSRRLRQRYPAQVRKYLWGKHFWSPSYFAASCSGAPLTIIKQYIEQHDRPA